MVYRLTTPGIKEMQDAIDSAGMNGQEDLLMNIMSGRGWTPAGLHAEIINWFTIPFERGSRTRGGGGGETPL